MILTWMQIGATLAFGACLGAVGALFWLRMQVEKLQVAQVQAKLAQETAESALARAESARQRFEMLERMARAAATDPQRTPPYNGAVVVQNDDDAA